MPTSALDEEVGFNLVILIEASKLMLKLSKSPAMLENEVAISRDASNNGCHL